jgi:hypothetical protein
MLTLKDIGQAQLVPLVSGHAGYRAGASASGWALLLIKLANHTPVGAFKFVGLTCFTTRCAAVAAEKW